MTGWFKSQEKCCYFDHFSCLNPQPPAFFCQILIQQCPESWVMFTVRWWWRMFAQKQGDRLWRRPKRAEQAAIVLALHRAASRIHGVWKSERGFSLVLIKSLNMRECGGLLFGPRRELTREACCRWKRRFVEDGARTGLRHRRSTMAVTMTARGLNALCQGGLSGPQSALGLNKTSLRSSSAQVAPTKTSKKSPAAPDAAKDQVNVRSRSSAQAAEES